MCGRARCTLRPEDLPRACGINDPSIPTVDVDRYHPSYNVSPGSYLPVLCNQEGSGHSTVVRCMKWGLIPSFTKKTEKPDHFRMFNARSESIFEKPSFRRLLPNNRCLVAVEGFYEWKKDGSKKQPYYIHFEDHRPLVFAALYDSWVNSEGEVLYTFTIMTTCCSSALQWLHDRMPVILGSKSSVDVWLNNSSSSKYDSIFRPYGESDLVWHPVTPEMGKPSFNGPECIKEIQLKFEDKNEITKFFTKIKTETKSDPEPEVKCSPEGSVSGDTYEGFKVELDTDEKEVSIISKGGKNDVKSEASSVINRDKKYGIKRVHEEFLTDFGSATEEPPMQHSARKKGNYKNAEDKQPTLLSFFGKR